jgi:phosphoadenosine phosphosulfate reductase
MIPSLDKLTLNQVLITELDKTFQTLSPQKILRYALKQFENLAISFSGAEDVVLIDMALKIKKNVRVFTLDTGRLHTETYQFIEKVRQHYGITVEVVFPDAAQVEKLVAEKGFFSFYQDGHKECCGIRKVAPLRRQLSTLDAWITGQRHDQNPSTRASVPTVQIDTGFSTSDRTLVKFNPLANWTSAQVWQYIRAYEVPYNLLHEKGYVSIGCEPCTRPVLPHQHEREGRWWWEKATDKECGLHAINTQNGSSATVNGSSVQNGQGNSGAVISLPTQNSSAEVLPNVTLIKKVKQDGQLCAKSARVLLDLEQRGLLNQIRQVTADERDRGSEGYVLAAQYQVDTAPFFIVQQPGSNQVYTAYHRFLKEVFNQETSADEAIAEIMAQSPSLATL